MTQTLLIDFHTLEELATLEPPESYPTMHCALSPDGALLAQLTGRNGVVHLWDLRGIRAELSKIGLDWNLPAYPAASPTRDWRPGDVVIESGSAADQ